MNYKVSVVTPFHNVDMGMFAVCAESVRKQTLGFGNIEWIIVAHNCTPGCMERLADMFKDDGNVIVRELNNDVHTPSSPRNYGTTFATAPYVAYLDGDDSFTPDCLEVAVREAVDTQSQIVWFRRESESERPGISVPMATTLWNNTMERIIVERDNWDDARMFSGSFYFVTSYLYELEFLRLHKLTFSETILFGEDLLFVVEACAQAPRICYLPQHIGYHYYVNGNSLVQSKGKSADTLIKYSEGFSYMFKVMGGYGIDPQEFTQIICGFVLSRFILDSPQLTVEDRRKIKDIIGPDVSSMYMLPGNKVISDEMRETACRVAQDVILNPENPGGVILRQEMDGINEMKSILKANADTDFGRRYNFSGVKAFEAFQYRIPTTDAGYYEPLIRLQTNVGETQIFTMEPVNRYYRTVNGNLVPSTPSHSRKFAECFASLLKGRNNLLVARSKPVIATTNDGAEIDTLNSSIVKDYFSQFLYAGGLQQAGLSSPAGSYFKQDNGEDNYRDLMVDALMVADINRIVSLNTEELLKAFTVLENEWRDMVAAMPDCRRKDEVARILEDGFDKPVAQRLWPELERVVAFGAGEMYESFNALKRYTGGIPHNHGYYFTEETIFGKAVADDSGLFECILDYNVHELLPIADIDGTRPLLWSNCKVGETYFIVVTNHAGLYRYQTDHTVCPREITPDSIKFTIY